ncbi:hypothetical protein HJC23_012408 [Cyclotella cryptica]|uniref:Uncharacterized protein n=1 Tax=Cyclotella cryptica TaxID=29204 RepID=A0ABD3Q204_9STRA|eukprot:CCRYP_009342-RA/>CCRYP_009342-RA protein AED:0.41 eAED:0.41 QI:0/-1/0/1/-1/1/1/0/649
MPSSPPVNQQRKRRRGIDAPADSDVPNYDDQSLSPSINGDGSKKRVRRRGIAEGDHSPMRQSETSTHVKENEEGRKHAGSEGQNGHYAQARTSSCDRPRSHVQSLVQTTTARAANTVRRESSSASQVSLSLLHNGRLKDSGIKYSRKDPSSASDESSPSDAVADSNNHWNGTTRSDRENDDFMHRDSSLSFEPKTRRSRMKSMILVYLITTAFAIVILSSVLHAVDFQHKLITLETDAIHQSATDKYRTLLEERNRLLHHYQDRVQTMERQLKLSQQTNAQLNRDMAHMKDEHTNQMKEYTNIFKQHESDLNEAIDRIKVLRGNREDKSSALDMAWLRMDELMEENNELSHHLNEAKKHQLFVARDRELIYTMESLTHQLTAVSDEKDNLTVMVGELSERLMQVSSEYEQMEFDHNQMMAMFFAPILSYVLGLQQTSEQQHAIILELTSLVHSLHTSLELTQSVSQVQFSESQHAVDAIAVAAGEFASQQAQRYEMERSTYMEQMEHRLTRMEDEALGAVLAVAEAAGKLEYERKTEEETRWRSYVSEVEKTLDGIGRRTERDLLSHGDTTDKLTENDSNQVSNGGSDAWESEYDIADELQGIIETSVLRAAISRRIEEGIASLRKYIHPYNYLRDKRDLYPWESTSEE